MIFDLTIVGGGPAGVAAGVYAARKQIKTCFLTYDFGGQSIVSDEIQNWIGTPTISGLALAKQLETHLRAYEGEYLTIKTGAKIKLAEKNNQHFSVINEQGESIETKTILVATGAHRRKLEVPGADIFEQKGITYCATCDGPLFAGQDLAVIGGGNAGFETALQLLAYAKSVTLLHQRADFKADAVTIEKALADLKFTARRNVAVLEIKGDKFVTGLIYKDKASNKIEELATTGIFVEIGFIPTTAPVKNLVKLNEYGSIIIDPRTGRTSQLGIWAAGDCTDTLYHQNNIAAGDAVRALEDIYLHLKLKSDS